MNRRTHRVFLSTPLLLLLTVMTSYAQNLESTGSRAIDLALARRPQLAQTGMDKIPDSPLIHLGMLLPAPLHDWNVQDPLDTEGSTLATSRDVLENTWGITSRSELLRVIDRMLFEGMGLRARQYLREYTRDPKILDETSDRGWAIRYLSWGSEYYDLKYLDAYEFGRASSMVRWGYDLGHLSALEAAVLFEDLGMVAASRGWDFTFMVEAQALGIRYLSGFSDHVFASTRNRVILSRRLQDEGPWTPERWEAAITELQTLLDTGSLGLPDYARLLDDWDGVPEEYLSAEASLVETYEHEYQFYQAIKGGDLETVRNILSSSYVMEEEIPYGATWVSLAVHTPEVLRYLLSRGFSPHKVSGTNKHSPFHVAAKYNEVESMRILHAAGAQPSARDVHGAEPLQWAATWDSIDAVRLLLDEYQVKVNELNNTGVDALNKAITMGHEELALYLLSRGANPFLYRSSINGTTLENAASSGLWQVVSTLLDLGLNPRQTNDLGYNAFTFALQERAYTLALQENSLEDTVQAIDKLIELMPELRMELDGRGANLLYYITGFASGERLLEEIRLVESGRMAGMPDTLNLHVATELLTMDKRLAFTAVLSLFKDLDTRSPDGRRLLDIVLASSSTDWALETLASFGVNLNEPNSDGHTPLALTMREQRWELFVRLVEAGADINRGYEEDLLPYFTSFLWRIQNEVDLEEAKSLILRLIDAGARLQFYRDSSPHYYSMPYRIIFVEYFAPITVEILEYAISRGQDFLSRSGEEMLELARRGALALVPINDYSNWLLKLSGADDGVALFLRRPNTPAVLRLEYDLEAYEPGTFFEVKFEFLDPDWKAEEIVVYQSTFSPPTLFDTETGVLRLDPRWFVLINGEPGISLKFHFVAQGSTWSTSFSILSPKFVNPRLAR